MDFDELLMQINVLFRDHPDILLKYQEKFRYVLVDEYQDTNFSQHLIVTRLCEHHRRICVVGDDAQSIYSFRGANIDNMLRFKDNYPDCRIFKLEQNYRSTQNIVNAANSLIYKNERQIPKTVYSENEPGSKIRILPTYSDYEEGYLIASQIAELRLREGCGYADFAVLYRTNAQSRVLEETLRKRNIAYRVYGSQSFYQRKEIKDIIAYFRVVVNPHDAEALRRIINFPARGIGETTVSKLLAAAAIHRVSMWTALGAPADYGVSIHEGTARKLSGFRTVMESLIAENAHLTAGDMAQLIVRRSGIATAFYEDSTTENISRQENLQELLNAIAAFCANRREEGAGEASLTDFLMEVSLISDQDTDRPDEVVDKVTLMTVHAAKGLEFDNVFVAGMEENLFPPLPAKGIPQAVEEERRLFYVAVTRARKHCIITYAQSRFRNGAHTVCRPSHFLDDLDPRCIDFRPTGRGAIAQKPGFQPYVSRNMPPEAAFPAEESRTKIDRQHVADDEKVDSLAGFHTGDRVYHARFGAGKILSLEGNGGDARARIRFDSDVKNLLLKYARLTLLKEDT